MLPPLPASRQASYAYSLRRKPSSLYPHRTSAEGSVAAAEDFELQDDDEDDRALEEEMGREQDEEQERGLEETLEKLGFGAYHWRLLALCGFGWMSDNSALQCIGMSTSMIRIISRSGCVCQVANGEKSD